MTIDQREAELHGSLAAGTAGSCGRNRPILNSVEKSISPAAWADFIQGNSLGGGTFFMKFGGYSDDTVCSSTCVSVIYCSRGDFCIHRSCCPCAGRRGSVPDHRVFVRDASSVRVQHPGSGPCPGACPQTPLISERIPDGGRAGQARLFLMTPWVRLRSGGGTNR
jgi:hypothetical protein